MSIKKGEVGIKGDYVERGLPVLTIPDLQAASIFASVQRVLTGFAQQPFDRCLAVFEKFHLPASVAANRFVKPVILPGGIPGRRDNGPEQYRRRS